MTDNEWVLVPRGVTPEMESVYANETGAYQSAQALHDAMLAAAPSPPADAGRGGLVGDLLTDLRAAATLQRPLTHGEVDDIGRRINDALTAKAAHPAPDPLPPELEGTLSPMAEMAEALRRKAEIERERYEDRRQSGEWGPAPDAVTQADFCPSCDGSGWDGESRTDLCPACNGGREPEPRKAAAPAPSYAADASGDGTIVGPDGHRLSVDEIVAGLNAAPAPGVGEVVAWMRRHVTYAAVDGRTAGERVVSERQVYPDDIPLYTAPPAPQGDQVSAAFVAGYRAGGHDYTSSRITDLEELDRNAREHPNAKEIATRVAIAAQAGEVGNG